MFKEGVLEAIQDFFFYVFRINKKNNLSIVIRPLVCDKYFQVKQLGVFFYQLLGDLSRAGISFREPLIL